jgi:hypothetical protein
MSGDYFKTLETDDKAGYNQAGKITEILAMLRGSFISSMMHNDFLSALESCRGVLNVIAGKASVEVINRMNKDVDTIEGKLYSANQTYLSEGGKYWTHPKDRIEVKKLLEDLWRNIESIQDEYGYGMFSEDDSGL